MFEECYGIISSLVRQVTGNLSYHLIAWALVCDNKNMKNVSLGDKDINHNCLFKHSIARTVDNFLCNVGDY
jgi:hypothetical protein